MITALQASRMWKPVNAFTRVYLDFSLKVVAWMCAAEGGVNVALGVWLGPQIKAGA